MSIVKNELNQGIVAKQLAILFLENDYSLGYDKRFESLKPQLSKDIDYLYDGFENDRNRPKYYFTVKNEEVEGYIQVSDEFDGMHFTKYSHFGVIPLWKVKRTKQEWKRHILLETRNKLIELQFVEPEEAKKK